MGKIVMGVSLLVLSLGIANAEDYFLSISKVDGKKITAKYIKIDPDAKKEKGKGKGFKGPDFTDAESKTFTVATDAKVMKRGKFDLETKKVGESTALDDGLKNKMFIDATTEAPLRATVKTNDKGEITEITVGGGFGDFKKKKKNNDTSAD